ASIISGAAAPAVADQVLVGWSDGETSAERTTTVGPFGATFQPLYTPSDIVNRYTRTQVTIDPADHKWPSMNNVGDFVWSEIDHNGFWQVFVQGPSANRR